MSTVDVSGDWSGWRNSAERSLLKPERPWEGADLPLYVERLTCSVAQHARLLYTNDYNLQQDFENREILPGGALGRIYNVLREPAPRPGDLQGGRPGRTCSTR